MAKGRWSIVDKMKGESHESHSRRAHSAYKERGIEEKIRSGRWLSKEQYEALTGRPGRDDNDPHGIMTRHKKK